jgi:hypothetical protein
MSMWLNPVRKGLVKRPEDWRGSSYNNPVLDKATVAPCPTTFKHHENGYQEYAQRRSDIGSGPW